MLQEPHHDLPFSEEIPWSKTSSDDTFQMNTIYII